MDHAEEIIGQLVVADSDDPVDLEMAEHALDALALPVERAVSRIPPHDAACPGGNPKGVCGLPIEASQALATRGVRMKTDIKRLLWVLAVLFVLYQISKMGAPSSPPSLLPPEQSAFIDAKREASRNYDLAPNDLVKTEIADQWARDVCRMPPSPDIRGWKGRVRSIISGFEQPLIFLDIGENISLSSSVPSGPILDAVRTMRKGDEVVFSGQFRPDGEGCPVKLIGVYEETRVHKPSFEIELFSIAAQ